MSICLSVFKFVCNYCSCLDNFASFLYMQLNLNILKDRFCVRLRMFLQILFSFKANKKTNKQTCRLTGMQKKICAIVEIFCLCKKQNSWLSLTVAPQVVFYVMNEDQNDMIWARYAVQAVRVLGGLIFFFFIKRNLLSITTAEAPLKKDDAYILQVTFSSPSVWCSLLHYLTKKRVAQITFFKLLLL